MNGFINYKKLAVCLMGGLTVLAAGCSCYRNVVDPCYPERYEAEARHNIYDWLRPQVMNGHILDQTVWNYHFEKGTATLTPGGVEFLAYVVRRRPMADPIVYLQTAMDVPLDSNNPEKFVVERTNLDMKRVEAVRRSLAALNGARPQMFEVVVHDPHEVGQSSGFAGRVVQQRDASAMGSLPSGGASGGAASPGVGSGGGGGGGGGSSGGK